MRAGHEAAQERFLTVCHANARAYANGQRQAGAPLDHKASSSDLEDEGDDV